MALLSVSPVAVLVAAVGLASAGCAMSPDAYFRLANATAGRNAESLAAAEVALETRGYVFVDAELERELTLTEESARACEARRFATSTLDDPPLTILLSGAGTARVAAASEVMAPASVTCSFFGFRSDVIELQQPREAAPLRWERLPNASHLVRARDGRLALVLLQPRATRRPVHVDFEQTCNAMPDPGPGPFDWRRQPVRVRSVTAATEKIDTIPLPYDVEELDVHCTHTVY